MVLAPVLDVFFSNHKQKQYFGKPLIQLDANNLKGSEIMKTTSLAYSWLQTKANEKFDNFRYLWE